MKQQKGATLLVVLILLVLMSLAATMSFNSGRIFSAIVGNQQSGQATTAVAHAALEEVMSRTFFAESPASPIPMGGNTTSSTKSFDVNGDGTNDVTVTVASCIKNYAITTITDPTTEPGCISGEDQNKGIAGAGSAQSCADVIWELTATATDSVTEASTTVIQGVRIRQPINAATNTAHYCP